MKKKFKDLSPEDFSGVDPVKFEEWKKERFTANRNYNIVLAIVTVLLIIELIVVKGSDEMISGEILIVGALVLIVLFGIIISLIFRKFRRLSNELGITPSMIRKALRGE